jgi:hypothetical protein
MCGVCVGQSGTEAEFSPDTSECQSQSSCLVSGVGIVDRITKEFGPTTLKIRI